MSVRSSVTIRADFPSDTVGEALTSAEEELHSLPFEVVWHEIQIRKFYESNMWREASKEEQDERREEEWTWVATLKAKGLSRS